MFPYYSGCNQILDNFVRDLQHPHCSGYIASQYNFISNSIQATQFSDTTNWSEKFATSSCLIILITLRPQTVLFLSQTILVVLVTFRSLTVLLLSNTIHISLITL